jgi:hypothetical protein
VILGSTAWAADWYVPGDFATIQDAIDSSSVVNGDRILVGPGSHAGALVNKGVEIKGEDGTTISSGPVHGSGLIQGFRLFDGSSGATISHLNFTVDLAIMNAAGRSDGPNADDVTISQNTFLNAVQAVSNWGGSRWNITHNEIVDLRTRNGGGIGVLIADYLARSINDNLVGHNKILGTLHVCTCDRGGYAGSGIVLYADFRDGSSGASEISWNRVIKNHISLVSDNAGLVDVVAFELTDTREAVGVIHDNVIGFNDFRGTANQIALTPPGLDNPENNISRNFGENRGHGLHPSVFGPGGN